MTFSGSQRAATKSRIVAIYPRMAIPLIALLGLLVAACCSSGAQARDAKAAGSREGCSASDGVTLEKTITNSIGYRMVLIPIGSAELGGGVFPTLPRRQYTQDKPIYFGVFEVSNEQYAQFDEMYRSGERENPTLNAANLPVCFVTWSQADAFCHWLSRKEGRRYRMPRADEWEYVARAGRGFTYPWGNNWPPLPSQANLAFVDPDDPDAVDPDGFKTPSPVGSFPANPWGVHDLAGNVREWCQDPFLLPLEAIAENERFMGALSSQRYGLRMSCGVAWGAEIKFTEDAYAFACAWRGKSDASRQVDFPVGIRLVMEP